MTRFTEFQKNVQIAPNIRSARLAHFVEAGLMVTSGEPGHKTYLPTEKGLDFKAVIIALTEWSDRWAAPGGAPIIYEHERCGGRARHELYCTKCEEKPRPQDIAARKTAVMETIRSDEWLGRPGTPGLEPVMDS